MKQVLAIAYIFLIVVTRFFFAGSVMAPDREGIVDSIRQHLEAQGFSALDYTPAGRAAVVAQRNDCLMYVVAIEPQGWNQEGIKMMKRPDQSLWFSYGGHPEREHQKYYENIMHFYFQKALAYIGQGGLYRIPAAILASDDCDVKSIDFHFQDIPFRIAYVVQP